MAVFGTWYGIFLGGPGGLAEDDHPVLAAVPQDDLGDRAAGGRLRMAFLKSVSCDPFGAGGQVRACDTEATNSQMNIVSCSHRVTLASEFRVDVLSL